MNPPPYDSSRSAVANIKNLLTAVGIDPKEQAVTFENAMAQLSTELTRAADAMDVIDADETVAGGDRKAVNTTAGAITVTLPADPEVGDVVQLLDPANTWDTNNVTVARNGKPINSAASNLTLSTEGGQVLLVFINDTIGWKTYYAASPAGST